MCLADFGVACESNNTKLLKKKCGTPGYCAPELFSADSVTHKSDVFSLGALFFQMLKGKRMFKGTTAKEILHNNIMANTMKLLAEAHLEVSPEC